MLDFEDLAIYSRVSVPPRVRTRRGSIVAAIANREHGKGCLLLNRKGSSIASYVQDLTLNLLNVEAYMDLDPESQSCVEEMRTLGPLIRALPILRYLRIEGRLSTLIVEAIIQAQGLETLILRMEEDAHAWAIRRHYQDRPKHNGNVLPISRSLEGIAQLGNLAVLEVGHMMLTESRPLANVIRSLKLKTLTLDATFSRKLNGTIDESAESPLASFFERLVNPIESVSSANVIQDFHCALPLTLRHLKLRDGYNKHACFVNTFKVAFEPCYRLQTLTLDIGPSENVMSFLEEATFPSLKVLSFRGWRLTTDYMDPVLASQADLRSTLHPQQQIDEVPIEDSQKVAAKLCKFISRTPLDRLEISTILESAPLQSSFLLGAMTRSDFMADELHLPCPSFAFLLGQWGTQAKGPEPLALRLYGGESPYFHDRWGQHVARLRVDVTCWERLVFGDLNTAHFHHLKILDLRSNCSCALTLSYLATGEYLPKKTSWDSIRDRFLERHQGGPKEHYVESVPTSGPKVFNRADVTGEPEAFFAVELLKRPLPQLRILCVRGRRFWIERSGTLVLWDLLNAFKDPVQCLEISKCITWDDWEFLKEEMHVQKRTPLEHGTGCFVKPIRARHAEHNKIVFHRRADRNLRKSHDSPGVRKEEA